MSTKALLLTAAFSLVMVIAPTVPANSEVITLSHMVDATHKDYEGVLKFFQAHKRRGSKAMAPEKKFLDEAVKRIMERRKILSEAMKGNLPAAQEGLFRMLAREVDGINVSLLALIVDDKGYAGYLRTGDQKLMPRIKLWQRGIKLSLHETRRSVALARKAAGPFELAGASR